MPPPHPQPTVTHTHLSLFDPRALVLALQEGSLEHVQLQKGLFVGQIAHSQSSQCRTDWGHYNLALLCQGSLSPGWITIAIPLHGDGPWHIQGEKHCNGDIILYTAGSEMCISLPQNTQWLCIQVPRQRLDMLGLRLPPNTPVLHLPGRLAPETAIMLRRLAAVLGPQREHSPHAALSEQMHEDLLQIIWPELARRWRLPTRSTVTRRHSRQVLLQSVRHWCEEQGDSPLRMDVLCQELDLPIWQLERTFRQSYGVPPQRLLTLHRLAKARCDLFSTHERVTQIAMANGFWHLGRFAQLYKDYFCESPSETARMHRQ